MKKIYILVLLLLIFDINLVQAGQVAINGAGLPGSSGGAGAVMTTYIPRLIAATLIKYTAVVAVIAVIISGIMYTLSFGQEDKAKKAKNWIIYSLVGVLISISAYAIVSLINSLKI